MKRSEINALLLRATEFCAAMGFHLPPWAFRAPDEWAAAGGDDLEIRDLQLGWDITDFGLGRFSEVGLVLFTLRNGHPDPALGYDKPYCEKLLIVEDRQLTPFHYHLAKTEDIICRGGADLLLRLHHRGADGRLAGTPVTVSVDGRRRALPAGGVVRLTPGESITLPPTLYHEFWAEGGTSLVGEVSKVNDDHRDNFFLDPVGRFPAIEEDEPPRHLLCWEYPAGGAV